MITFSCKAKFDMKNINVPNRTYGAECAWVLGKGGGYLGSYCDPASNINSASFPTCDGTLENCRERSNAQRFGGFTSIPENTFYISG